MCGRLIGTQTPKRLFTKRTRNSGLDEYTRTRTTPVLRLHGVLSRYSCTTTTKMIHKTQKELWTRRIHENANNTSFTTTTQTILVHYYYYYCCCYCYYYCYYIVPTRSTALSKRLRRVSRRPRKARDARRLFYVNLGRTRDDQFLRFRERRSRKRYPGSRIW